MSAVGLVGSHLWIGLVDVLAVYPKKMAGVARPTRPGGQAQVFWWASTFSCSSSL